jgi:ADP-heptose:LPS heptosyltransferase
VPLLAGNPMVDPRVIDGGCDNTIDEFAALIERADLVVTPDSLAFHLATALHRPIVVIVGPTSPWELELYGRGEAISADVPCIACYRRACQKPVTCMDLLRPEHVYSACERVRGASPALQWCLLDERNHPD